MPQEVDQLDSKLNIKVFPSKTVELMAALHLIADKNHHGFMPKWSKHVIEGLSSESRATLELISSMNFPGLGTFDFIIKSNLFDDVEKLLQYISTCNELDFAFAALNEEVDKAKLQQAKENPREFHNIVEGLSIAASGSERAMKAIIYDTRNYMDSYVKLIREIYSLGFEEELEKIQGLYEEQIESVRSRLKHKGPLQLAEEIKGTKVNYRNEYAEYLFVPSYFLHHHNIISDNYGKFMLVFNININNIDISEEAERIAELLKVLSDKSRLEILRQLRRRPTYGKVLASRLNLTTATISRHLEQLRAINLIREAKSNGVKYFRVNREELDKLMEDIKNFINS